MELCSGGCTWQRWSPNCRRWEAVATVTCFLYHVVEIYGEAVATVTWFFYHVIESYG